MNTSRSKLDESTEPALQQVDLSSSFNTNSHYQQQ